MKNAYMMILSGGRGERLWPLSRKRRPKQFLPFLDERTLLEHTIDRVFCIAEKRENIGVVTTVEQKELVSGLLSKKIGFIVDEPVSRNTAPAILYTCFKLSNDEQDPVVAFLPADSFVIQNDKYAYFLKSAIDYASWNNKIVTLGVMPTNPSTAYGYIQADCKWDDKIDCGKFYNVFKFHEKPSIDLAKKYMQHGNMFWNISVFVARVSVLLKEFKQHAPELFCSMKQFLNGEKEYSELNNISIDYAVMEKSQNIIIIPCDFEWSDVGNLNVFLSLQKKLSKKDSVKVINIDCDGNLAQIDNKIFSKEKVVAFIGVSDLCLIEQDDVVLISKRNQSDKVKEVLAKIKEQELGNFL
ncbi:mannose-1-phosphate guanylyltransferase [Candidatus Dependentiae bacterium]